MKHLALVLLAACSFAQSACGRAIDFTAPPASYAAKLRRAHIVVVPVYSGRSLYAGVPVVVQYQLIGPTWSDLLYR